MLALDRIVSVVVLTGTGGVLVFRAFRAWAEYRLQRRSVDLLVRSMSEIEEPDREHRP